MIYKDDDFEEFIQFHLFPNVKNVNQRILTPLPLCRTMLNRKEIRAVRSTKGKEIKILVVNNVEFLWALNQLDVDMSRVWFSSDCGVKLNFASGLYSKVNIVPVSILNWVTDMTNVMKFDVIIGNPPFQAPAEGDYSYWARFIQSSMGLLNKGGILAFITPQGYLSPTGDIRVGRVSVLRDIMANHNTTLINLKSSIADYFKKISSTFSYFIIENETNKGKTEIVSDDGAIIVDLSTVKYIPKGRVSKQVISIFSRVSQIQPATMAWTHKAIRGEDSLYEKVDTINTPYKVINGNSKYKDDFWWAKDKPENFDSPKVIVPYNGADIVFIYDNGNCGYGKTTIYLVDTKNGETVANVQSYLDSKLVRFLLPIDATEKYTQYNEPAYLNMLPKVDLTRSWTDAQLYKHFNLEKEEIDLIEQTIK